MEPLPSHDVFNVLSYASCRVLLASPLKRAGTQVQDVYWTIAWRFMQAAEKMEEQAAMAAAEALLQGVLLCSAHWCSTPAICMVVSMMLSLFLSIADSLAHAVSSAGLFFCTDSCEFVLVASIGLHL